MFDKCFEYDDHLRASGHWAGGEAPQGPETALTLYWKNGKVTDGPYAETKEQLALRRNPARAVVHAAFSKATNSVRVAVRGCAFSSR